MSLLIPFAKNIKTGQLVEIGSPNRSDYNDCVCPSCEQSVIPRLGKERAWHFAHAIEPVHKPKRACERSFYACCRQFIIEMALKEELKTFTTPDYVIGSDDIAGSGVTVTVGSGLTGFERPVHAPPLDLLFRVDSYRLAVHLCYKSRPDPEPPFDSDTGVIALDLEFVAKRYATGDQRVGQIQALALELFHDALAYKRWIYHPRQEELIDDLREMDKKRARKSLRSLDRPTRGTPTVDKARKLTEEEMDSVLSGFRKPDWRR